MELNFGNQKAVLSGDNRVVSSIQLQSDSCGQHAPAALFGRMRLSLQLSRSGYKILFWRLDVSLTTRDDRHLARTSALLLQFVDQITLTNLELVL